MNISLKNKTALIGGGSQGIGRGIAKVFAEAGANLLIISRSEENLKNLIDELPRNNNQYYDYIACDYANPNELKEKVSEKISEIQPIQILVNNTGGPDPGPASTAPLNEFQKAFNMHLLSYQVLLNLLLPEMKANRWGRIINITSIGAKQPLDNLGVSNTVRGAVSSWAKIISRELAPFNITVNNILPGYILTERQTVLIESEAKRKGITMEEELQSRTKDIPIGFMGTPNDIGYAAAFLASDYARYITGINFPVDGGFLRTL
ncbi:MAG TPA: SDR family oxidoreductase [Candidatus Kapabacteria bacterium]|jgi:3-oxoacyl-[acyl-carrier protein] reductase|nr:SDR family oxidoreductase [Candidatus Kapabacteria bacterium]HOV92105.1 SDR family oxidoreductase [Candidatus Kapabacteria bacterium]